MLNEGKIHYYCDVGTKFWAFSLWIFMDSGIIFVTFLIWDLKSNIVFSNTYGILKYKHYIKLYVYVIKLQISF